MTDQLSATDRALLEAVARVDVMDTAGKLIANPRRAVISLAEQLAMAIAIEQFQAIAIEADRLARALTALPDHALDASASDEAYAVWMRFIDLTQALKAARGEPNTYTQETTDDQ